MKIQACHSRDKQSILDIFNHAILHTTALYDYRPRTPEMMDKWFADKAQGHYPIIGAYADNNELLGFSTYGPFRDRPGYKYTVEHSVYVKNTAQGRGIGKTLLKEIINTAINQNYHVLVAGIDSSNTISIKLHEKLGFTYSGTIAQAGYKFGQWLDLVFYQLILPTPQAPVEG